MRAIAHGHSEEPPATIENPDVLQQLRPVLRQ